MVGSFDEYVTAMKAADPMIKDIYDFGDGTCLIVKRLMFHWTLLQSAIGDMHEYFDRWCYETHEGAKDAAQRWINLKDIEDEPTGWHRHHKTGRRRTGGDPATEYIAH